MFKFKIMAQNKYFFTEIRARRDFMIVSHQIYVYIYVYTYLLHVPLKT